MSDDENTQYWTPGFDDESTGRVGGASGAPADRPPDPDDERTQIVAPGAQPPPTVRYGGDERNWLDPAPPTRTGAQSVRRDQEAFAEALDGVDGFDDVPRQRSRVGPRQGARWPRLVAPVAFLVAVIAILSIVIDSGVLNGTKSTGVSPKASASAKPTKKYYMVKRGDSLSIIAVKFNTSVGTLEDLNPGISASSLSVGQKIKLPQQ